MEQACRQITILETRAFVDQFIKLNFTEISCNANPIGWIMAKTMQHFKGGLNPIMLRPLATVAYYGNNAIVHVLQLTLSELSSMSMYMTEEQQIVLGDVENKIELVIESTRAVE